jgi:hypothetical protein
MGILSGLIVLGYFVSWSLGSKLMAWQEPRQSLSAVKACTA